MPTTFKPLIYYSDKRNSIPSDSKIVGNLTSKHTIFNQTNKGNSRYIVITSLLTLLTQYSPSALKGYRIKYKSQTKANIRQSYYTQDKDQEFDLLERFSIVTINEAYCIKNNKTVSYTTVQQLHTEFSILAIVSVLLNRINDFRNYMSFL